MRKILVFVLLVFLAVAPLTAVTYNVDSENKSTSSALVKMKLVAGDGAGVSFGFSSTPYEKNSDGTIKSVVTPVSTGELTVETPADMGEITASGLWYAYWVIRNLDSSFSLKLSWSSDAVDDDGNNLFSIYKDSMYKSSVDSTIKTFTEIGESYSGTYPLYIKTGDLREWSYGVEYKLVLKLEVLSN